ncbi:hypothetical protein JCM33374_g3126 [Metschnikowia sp. JCM 33374]|nr:hypothetical protein JCM33374_g3126 [Metschnikowia sp. JCM 33374]
MDVYLLRNFFRPNSVQTESSSLPADLQAGISSSETDSLSTDQREICSYCSKCQHCPKSSPQEDSSSSTTFSTPTEQDHSRSVVSSSSSVSRPPTAQDIALTKEVFASRSNLVASLAPQIRLIRPFNGTIAHEAIIRDADPSVWPDYHLFENCRSQAGQHKTYNAFLRWFLAWNIGNDSLSMLIQDQTNQAQSLLTPATTYVEVLDLLRTLDQLPFIHFRFEQVFDFLTTSGALSSPPVAEALRPVFRRSPHYFPFFATLDRNWWNLCPDLPGKPVKDPRRAHYIRNGRPFTPLRRPAARSTREVTAAIAPADVSIHEDDSYFSSVELVPNNKISTVYWDGGSVSSFISRAVVDAHALPVTYSGSTRTVDMVGLGLCPLSPEVATVKFTLKGIPGIFIVDCTVFDPLPAPILLGRDFFKTYDVCSRPQKGVLSLGEYPIPQVQSPPNHQFKAITNFSDTPSSEFLKMLDSFRHFRHDLKLPPSRPTDYRIMIKPGAVRARNRPLPSYSVAAHDFLRAEIRRLSDLGFIEPSSHRYFSIPSLVPKKTGGFRIVFDFRAVNAITDPIPTSLASFRSLMPGLSNSTVFSTLDLQSGYHQLRIHEDTKPFTAFDTPFGQFQWNVLPFGLTDAPQVFGSYMTQLLKPYEEFCRVYLDDILIHSPDPVTHLDHVHTILSTLSQAHHQVNWDKCQFHQSSIVWVGHKISAEGISPTDTFKGQVEALGVPTTKDDIRAFIGHVGYLQDMIPNYGDRASVLTDMLVKGTHFKWTSSAQAAFEDLKSAILNAAPLQSFDPRSPILIQTDASKFAASAVLLQPNKHDRSKWLPIEYRSKKFDSHQRNWDIHSKEFWAIKFACEKFRFYIEGRFFTLHCDQKSISQIFNQFHNDPDSLSPNILRWMHAIIQYNFSISYIPGHENVLADHLSRNPALAFPDSVTSSGPTSSTDVVAAITDVSSSVDRPFPSNSSSSSNSSNSSRSFRPSIRPVFVQFCPVPSNSVQFQFVQFIFFAGHPGIRRWLATLQKSYFFPDLKRVVENYVNGCDVCLRHKAPTSLPPGLLQRPTPPTGRWTDIATDLITGLPDASYYGLTVNAVLTIVCKFTNRVHFYPVSSQFSTSDFINLFLDRYFPLHGFPSTIQSDRGPQFTNTAFQSTMKAFNITSNLSVPRHQQSNGRVENRNKLIEQYLRLHINNNADWPKLLPLGEFVLNAQFSTSLGKSPFEVDLAYKPSAPADFLFPTQSNIADRYATDLSDSLGQIQNSALASHAAAFESAKYYSDKRHSDVQFREGDQVYIDCSDLQYSPDAHNSQLAPKLRSKYAGPYEIFKVHSPVNYELAMPSTYKGHRIFHIRSLRLKKTIPENYFIPENPEVALKKYKDGSELVEITAIVSHRRRGKGYSLRARGLPCKEFPLGETNEYAASALAKTAPDLVADYARKHRLTEVLHYCTRRQDD